MGREVQRGGEGVEVEAVRLNGGRGGGSEGGEEGGEREWKASENVEYLILCIHINVVYHH